MLKATAALRRGAGKPYLVFGRMQRPVAGFEPRTMTWTYGDRAHQAPAVFQGAWRSPQGRIAAVLANWTKEAQSVLLPDRRFSGRCRETISSTEIHSAERAAGAKGLELQLPPLSCALIEKV